MKTEKSGSHPFLSCLADPFGAFVWFLFFVFCFFHKAAYKRQFGGKSLMVWLMDRN